MQKSARWMGMVGATVVALGGVWLSRQAVVAQSSDAPKPPANAGPAAGGTPRSVEVTTPTRTAMSRRLDVPATMEAYEQADLFAKASGYISEVRVDIGDRVKAGDVIAVIDVPEMVKELAEVEALHAAVLAGVTTAESKVVQQFKMLDMARSLLVRAEAELFLKETTFKRRKALFAGKAIAQEQLDEAQSQSKIARADAGIAEARIAAAQAEVVNAEAARSAAAAQVEVARARVDRTQALLRYSRIVAPFDGVVSRRMVDRGALVQAGTSDRTMPLFTIERVDKLRIFIEVPESDIAFVRPGIPVKVNPYGLEGMELTARITRTASSLKTDTRTMRAEIDMDNPDGRLMHGMYAQVLIDIDARVDALTVPASSLLIEGKDLFVYTIVDNRAVRTPVRTGLDDGIRVQVTDGLTDSAMVVVTGKGLIWEGAPVRAVRRDERS